jgi:hypothetical protein
MMDADATWLVRTPHGDLPRAISTIELLAGIEEGWLTVDDEVHAPTTVREALWPTSTTYEKIGSAFRDLPSIAWRTNPQRYFSVVLSMPFGLVVWLLYDGWVAGVRSVVLLVSVAVIAGLVFGFQARRAYSISGSSGALVALALCPVGLLLLPLGFALAPRLAPGGRPQDIGLLIAFGAPMLAYALMLSSKGVAWGIAWRTACWLFLAPFLGIGVLRSAGGLQVNFVSWTGLAMFAAGVTLGLLAAAIVGRRAARLNSGRVSMRQPFPEWLTSSTHQRAPRIAAGEDVVPTEFVSLGLSGPQMGVSNPPPIRRDTARRAIDPGSSTGRMNIITSGSDAGWARCEYCQCLLLPEQSKYVEHIAECEKRPGAEQT